MKLYKLLDFGIHVLYSVLLDGPEVTKRLISFKAGRLGVLNNKVLVALFNGH